MRTFDFDGVVEGMAEVAGGIQKGEIEGTGPDAIETETITLAVDAEVKVQAELETKFENEGETLGPREVSEEPQLGEPTSESLEAVSLSEDESVDGNIVPDSQADSDEEILWPAQPLPKHDSGVKKKKKPRKSVTEAKEALGVEEGLEIQNDGIEKDEDTNMQPMATDGEEPTFMKSEGQKSPPEEQLLEMAIRDVGLMIIDNISRPIEGLLEKGEVPANSAFTLLSRSLRSFARDRGMAVLLLSTPVQQPVKAKDQKRDIFKKNSSVFARIKQTEGLPITFCYCVDLSVMVSRYPKDEAKANKRRSAGQEVLVAEVISERHGDSAGQWCAFTIKDGIEFVNVFNEKEEEKNLDHLLTENERRGKGAFGRWSRD
ncbi:hypothetical protein ABW20_dc0106889 [Dactylellina cionopaga]|nr:hypothetical protein ABW20_dc0106889 [Dactylellina cionopaga]